MPFYLLGDRSQPEDIGAVAIYLYAVTDERGEDVAGCSSAQDAEGIRARFAARYPSHTFTVKGAL